MEKGIKSGINRRNFIKSVFGAAAGLILFKNVKAEKPEPSPVEILKDLCTNTQYGYGGQVDEKEFRIRTYFLNDRIISRRDYPVLETTAINPNKIVGIKGNSLDTADVLYEDGTEKKNVEPKDAYCEWCGRKQLNKCIPDLMFGCKFISDRYYLNLEKSAYRITVS